MKKYWLLFFTLLSGVSYSQMTSTNNSETGHVEKEKFYTAMVSENWETEKLARNNFSSTNNLYIEQVGSNNTVHSSISSPDAIVNLGQGGNDNNIDLQLESEIIRYNVEQTGNNNYLRDHTYAPSEPIIKLNLQQNGNENQVLKYGTNSITNNLEFNVIGDSKTLIIRSFQ